MKGRPARVLAAAGTAGAGLAAGLGAYLLVGGSPGILYAAGITLATLVGAAAIQARGRGHMPELESTAAPRTHRWRRKSRLIAELELQLVAAARELDEHRQALANLGSRLTEEGERARATQLRLESRLADVELERNGLRELLAQERQRFERTLDELGGGIGRHGSELAELERELAALISR